MARVEVITCDQCHRRIMDEDTIIHIKIRQSGTEYITREYCIPCGIDLYDEIVGAGRKPKTPRVVIDPETREFMLATRAQLGHALERWADGATADELAEAMRDILSSGRRVT